MPYKRQKTKRREEVTFTQEPTEKILQEVITSLRKHPRKFQAAGVIGEPPLHSYFLCQSRSHQSPRS